MIKTWHDVWENKAERVDAPLTLTDLMRMDGYDISCSAVANNDLIDFVKELTNRFLSNDSEILEVGCGAGAICKILTDNDVKVTGIDYTKELMSIAKQVMPNNLFIHSDAISYDLEKKDFDLVLCHSVCQYFPSSDYMKKAMELMLNHTSRDGVIAITDVYDLELKEEHIKRRKEILGKRKYNELYKELSHYFFDRSFFINFSKKNKLNIKIERQSLQQLVKNYKFNVYLSKIL